MIKELTQIIKSKELDIITSFLSVANENANISMDDLAVSPLLALSIEKPFVYVVNSVESVGEVSAVFKNLGKRVASCEVECDMPLFSEVKQGGNELFDALNVYKSGGADVLVISASNLLSCVPSVSASSLEIKVNGKFDIKKLAGSLEDFGYTRVGRVTREGDFSQKGDVVDVWLADSGNPIRVMFFGDVVEAIKKIDSDDFSTIESLKDLKISPITSFANVSADLVRKKLDNVKSSHDNTKNIITTLYTKLEKGVNLGAIKWLSPLLYSQVSVLDYIKQVSDVIVFERPREVLESLRNHEKQNSARLVSLIEGGLLLAEHEKIFMSVANVLKEVESMLCVGFGGNHDLFKSKKSFNLKTLPTANYFSALGVLVPDIIRNVETHKKTVLVFVGNSKSLENYLNTKGVEFNVISRDKFALSSAELASLEQSSTSRSNPSCEIIKSASINIVYRTLGLSFEVAGSGVVVYSITSPSKAVSSVPQPRTSGEFVMPNIGEVVVHEFHGLGRYLGIKNLRLGSEDKDYMVLQYDGGAFVYVPLEQVGVLSNYHGEPTRLNRIGGKDFADAKQRVRRRLKELSFKLGELYVKRAKARPSVYDCDDSIMEEFFNSFLHPYTADQIKAITDIKNDMKSDKVMDRLICGDVGYGKTEVAMHACFRAIMSGYQVAMLCPTTILSVQHGNTASKRLCKFGVRVEVLNRFKTDSEVRDILDGLKSGAVDMVIGTHRLLSGDIVFKNLSLLILDEEQRFGVSHKEKIKTIKSNIDVLTLSATPIPRTLNMALVGIRDISNITTPPKNRSAILTYVSEYSDELVMDAILRESSRGGQVLVLYNNVQGIEIYATRLRKLLQNHQQSLPLSSVEACASSDLVPSVGSRLSSTSRVNSVVDSNSLRIDVIHGQMSTTRMEDTIMRTYAREIDVLVASTIIENGIDIATANTLIVVDADRLGVAQMHQLRGRVGRSDVQAYAYFTYAKNKEVSEVSSKRLDAISRFSGFGAGYNIAMRDLQIRGAGDLLGAEQSGHIDQVGFEVYMKILKEIASEIKGEQS